MTKQQFLLTKHRYWLYYQQVQILIASLNIKTEVIYQVFCSIYCQAEKPALSLPKGSRSPLNHLNIFVLALNECISTSLNVTEIQGFDA
jgi:hypothetical protein